MVDSASSRQDAAGLKKEEGSRRLQTFATIFVATEEYLLSKPGKEQVGQIQRACTPVRLFTAIDARMPQQIFKLLRRKAMLPLFLNGGVFSQSVLGKKTAAAKNILNHSALKTRENPFFTW